MQSALSPSQRIVSLRDLYAFAKKHKENQEALRLEKTRLGKEYCKLCDGIASVIDEAKGFYLWGCYDNKKYWRSIYLGKAGFGKTKSLRKRILEELKDERCCIWRAVFTVEQLHAIRNRIHNGRYERDWRRAMEKAGTTHIAWVPAPFVADENIEHVEADLIEAFNPKANVKRPTPPNTVQHDATKVFEEFRIAIHAARWKWIS